MKLKSIDECVSSSKSSQVDLDLKGNIENRDEENESHISLGCFEKGLKLESDEEEDSDKDWTKSDEYESSEMSSECLVDYFVDESSENSDDGGEEGGYSSYSDSE